MRYNVRKPALLLALGAVACGVAGCAVSLADSPLHAWRVPTNAMAPTLGVGDTVYTDSSTRIHLRVGEIVIFHPPRGEAKGNGGICGAHVSQRQLCPDPTGGRSSSFFIKRIVALGGERLAMFGGHVVINDKVQREPFARTSSCVFAPACNYPKPITIPRGYVFMLGDNRAASDDSRFWGPVPLSWVVGVAETCDRALKHCHVLG